MELPPSSDYTDMGRMSESPERNYPNNTVAIVGRPGLRPAPTSTGTGQLTIPSSYTHTHTCTHCPLLSWHPSLHPNHPMNKNENPKMDVEKEREGQGGSGGEKNKVSWPGSAGDFSLCGSHTLTGAGSLLSVSARSIPHSQGRPHKH